MQDNPFLPRSFATIADYVLVGQIREYRRMLEALEGFDDSFTRRTIEQLRNALRALESEVERRQSAELRHELSRGN